LAYDGIGIVAAKIDAAQNVGGRRWLGCLNGRVGHYQMA
jgi:hypothetical protein